MAATNRKLIRTVLLSGLLAGTLDICTACCQYYLKTGKDPLNVLRYVAGGAFGKTAFSGGTPMALWGLFFHYLIAMSFTVFFFLIYPRIEIMARNRVVTGIVYGLFIWLVMNRLVVPLSRLDPVPFQWKSALIGASILIVMIGIPLSFIANKYYRQALDNAKQTG